MLIYSELCILNVSSSIFHMQQRQENAQQRRVEQIVYKMYRAINPNGDALQNVKRTQVTIQEIQRDHAERAERN